MVKSSIPRLAIYHARLARQSTTQLQASKLAPRKCRAKGIKRLTNRSGAHRKKVKGTAAEN